MENTKPKSPRRWFALWFLIASAIGVVRHLPVIDEPWDGSVGSLASVRYQVKICRNWDELGFWECRGLPQIERLPGESRGAAYLHHPPGFPWLHYASLSWFGRSERGYRALPIGFTALSAGLVSGFAAATAGPVSGAVAAAVFLSVPMGFLHGSTPIPFSATLAFSILALLLHLRLRQASPRRWWLVPTTVALGTFIDWSVAFVIPAIGVDELTRSDRRIGRVAKLALTAPIVFVVTVLLFVWQLGSWGEVVEDFRNNLSTAVIHRDRWSLGDWLHAQGEFLLNMFGWPVLLAGVLVLPWFGYLLLERREAPLARLAVGSAISSTLFVVVFFNHSGGHEFWWFYALPFAALAVTQLARIARVWWVLRFAVVLAIVAFSVVQTYRIHTERSTLNFRDLGDWVATFATSRDHVLMPGIAGSEGFYIDAYLTECVDSRARLDQIVERWKNRCADRQAERLFVLMFPGADVNYPEIGERLPQIARPFGEYAGSIWLVE